MTIDPSFAPPSMEAAEGDAHELEQRLRVLLQSWHSSYCYTVRRESVVVGKKKGSGGGGGGGGGRCFTVEWSRRPSPHEPLPDVRVRMEVVIFSSSPSSSSSSSSSTTSPSPLYRLEDEMTVHEVNVDDGEVVGRLASIDGQLLRWMKMKAELYKQHDNTPSSSTRHPYTTTHQLNTRLQYQPYTPPSYDRIKAARTDSSSSSSLPPSSLFSFPCPSFTSADQWRSLCAALRPPSSSSSTRMRTKEGVKGNARSAGVDGRAELNNRAVRWTWDEEEDEEDQEVERQPTASTVNTRHGPVNTSAIDSTQPIDSKVTPSQSSVSRDRATSLSPPLVATDPTTTSTTTTTAAAASSAPAVVVEDVGGVVPRSAASSVASVIAPPPAPYSIIPSAAALEQRLIELFRQADVDGSGRLSVDEVTVLLSSPDLGLCLSCSSLHRMVVGLMCAYDENDDGQLVWAEFLPVAVDLIQASSASKMAKETMERQSEEGKRRMEERLGAVDQPHWTAEVAKRTAALDPSHTGILTPTQFIDMARALTTQLDDVECSAVMEQMERNGAGGVVYQPFQDHTLTFLADVIETTRWRAECSPLELDLLRLSATVDPDHSGTLSVENATAVLKATSQLGIRLSPTQLSLILGDDGPVVGGYDVALFVRRAALMLSSLFDRAAVVERSTLSERGVVAPIALLTVEDRERVEAELRQRFAEFDTNNDGTLDAVEFASCLSDTSLCLSSSQIEQLRKEVDTQHTGTIHIQQFMNFAYAKLLHLAREARIAHDYVNLTSLR